MLSIPNDFADLDSFTEWYIDNNMPYVPKVNTFPVETDDATAFTLFRHGRYQVEMYFMKANKSVPNHGHPDVEVNIYSHLESGEVIPQPTLKSMQIHGATGAQSRTKPFLLLSIQKWDEGVPMTSVAIHWVGYTSGPKHDSLISKYYPDALVKEGYADVRRDKLSGASYNR